MAEDGALKRLAVVLGLIALAVMLTPGFLMATVFLAPVLLILGLAVVALLVLFGGSLLETILTAKKAWTLIRLVRFGITLLLLPVTVLVRLLGRSEEGGKEKS